MPRKSVLTKRRIVTFEGRSYEKSIHEALVGSRVQAPKSLESATEHNKLEVVLESRERVYKCDQREKICRHLHGRGRHRRVQSRVHRGAVLSRSHGAVVQQRKERESHLDK